VQCSDARQNKDGGNRNASEMHGLCPKEIIGGLGYMKDLNLALNSPRIRGETDSGRGGSMTT